MSGSIESYLFQSCLLLFVNISSICLLGKGFAPLRCTCTVEVPWRLRKGYDCCVLKGRAHLTDSIFFGYIIALCCGQTVGNISQTVLFCTFLQLEWRWKASYRHFAIVITCTRHLSCKSQDWMKVEKNNKKRLKFHGVYRVYPVLINVSCLKRTRGFNMFQPPKKLIENAQWLLPRHGWRCSAATQVIGIPPVPPRYWTPRQSLFKLMNDDGFR
jgi:hypothetical protein